MSIRSRRRLLILSGIAWAIWLVALSFSLLTPVSSHHRAAQYAVMAVAIVSTFVWALFAAVAPVLAALRALLAEQHCPFCADRVAQGYEERAHAA